VRLHNGSERTLSRLVHGRPRNLPSFQSIVRSIVEREEIGTGLALNATQFNLSRILDILRQRPLRAALLTVLATSVLCSPLVTFTPILVREIFQGNAGRFSIAVASFGVGGLLGATGLLGVAPGVDQRQLSSGSALAYGAVLILTGFTPWFWSLPPLLVLAGAAMTVSNTSANSLLQATAGAHLGQTVSLYMLAVRGGSSIGALVTGAEIGLLGVQHALLLKWDRRSRGANPDRAGVAPPAALFNRFGLAAREIVEPG
jgi:hypothetical protein